MPSQHRCEGIRVKLEWLRWVLLLPALFGAFVSAFVITGWLQEHIGRWWRKADFPNFNPEFCFKPAFWKPSFYAAGGTLATILVVSVGLWITPRHKLAVARLVFASGANVAATLVITTELSLSVGLPVLLITCIGELAPIVVSYFRRKI